MNYCPSIGCHYPSTPTRAPVATERILEVGGTAQYTAPPIPSYFRQEVVLFLRFQKWQINNHRRLPAPMSYIYSEEICHNFLANFYPSNLNIGFPGGSVVKNPPANAGDAKDMGLIPGSDPWGGKIPWSGKWQPAPVFLPGKFHGQRSLVGYSPWGRKESDTTEATEHSHMHIIYIP